MNYFLYGVKKKRTNEREGGGRGEVGRKKKVLKGGMGMGRRRRREVKGSKHDNLLHSFFSSIKINRIPQ